MALIKQLRFSGNQTANRNILIPGFLLKEDKQKSELNVWGKPLLSIIVIAYNEEKYLPVLLDSLNRQTFTRFELIVVDSNSTDDTERVAMEFENKFENFRFIKLDKPRGPAYARNQGAEAASYERLIFLDADTRLKHDFIQKVMHELEKSQADVATCPIRIREGALKSNMGAMFLNAFMIGLRPVYSAAYGACFITTKTVHQQIKGFREDLGVCEDCNYVKRARRDHQFSYQILSPIFYTSDRRALNEGEIGLMLKYIKIHTYRMFTGKEVLRDEITYDYGSY
jgi:glycosyltransferase involved in cell wall biosynthesis